MDDPDPLGCEIIGGKRRARIIEYRVKGFAFDVGRAGQAVANGHVFEMGLTVCDALGPAAEGRWLEALLDCFQPTVSEFLEVQLAYMFGLAESRDFLPEFGKPTIGKRAFRSLERPAKLLAVTIDEGIVNA